MKTRFLFLGICLSIVSIAQDVPSLSQKLSDGVWQFPSLTGLSGGSAFVGHHRYAGSLQNAPILSMAGAHSSFANDRVGIGGNLFYETINVYKNVSTSFQFAHHIPLSSKQKLSFGLSTEYIRTDLDRNKLEAVDLSDPIVKDFSPTQRLDFSPGISISHKRYQIGFTANRARKLLGQDKTNYLTGFYTGFAHLIFTDATAFHNLEPSVIVRFDPIQKAFKNEAWLFYTYAEKYTLGTTYVSNGRLGLALAYIWDNRFVLGYNFDSQLGNSSSSVYGKYAHEVVLRFNFNKQYYRKSSFEPEKRSKKDISNQKED
jgi:type IX secretion system PorP/SprF family membrane protein